MPIKVFTIPVRHADWAERELNQFVQSHRVLAVFTNDHLAQMVERRVKNKADLEQIAGIGEARMEKYGPRVLEFLNNFRKVTDETGGEPAGTDR